KYAHKQSLLHTDWTKLVALRTGTVNHAKFLLPESIHAIQSLFLYLCQQMLRLVGSHYHKKKDDLYSLLTPAQSHT
ncbi:Hypothetical predicted protein, partial [Pelobates cultripes]